MDKGTMNKAMWWYVVNVVWYDGVDAYVSKFVLQVERVETDGEGVRLEPTNESKWKVEKYLQGNGDVLKYDPLYGVDFENIIAFKGYEKSDLRSEQELFAAYDRFKNMWF